MICECPLADLVRLYEVDFLVVSGDPEKRAEQSAYDHDREGAAQQTFFEAF
jgi:hypothetical protein